MPSRTATDEAGAVIVSSFARALLLFMSAMVETAKVFALANVEMFNTMKVSLALADP